MEDRVLELFQNKLKVVNIGQEHFAEALRGQGVQVEQVEFHPLAEGDEEMIQLLLKMGY
ncbi:MAG: hypothetical protein WBW79_15265 [Desulfocapsaceae bacterium]